MARALLSLVLLASFTANPIGAVTHAWAHAAQASSDKDQTPHHGHAACELCAAYAAVEHGSSAAPLALAAVPPVQPTVVATPAATPARPHVHYRQRAPPPLRSTI